MLTTDVIRQVTRSFGDTDQILITNADLFDWINEAQKEICEKTECLVTTVTFAASTFPRVFPSDFIRASRILYGNVALTETNLKSLDTVGTDLSVRQSAPVFFYFRNRNIHLYPLQPNADTTVVTIDYVAYATVVIATGTILDTPQLYHDDIVKYTLSKAHERNENSQGYNQSMGAFTVSLDEDMDTEFNKVNTYPIIQDDPYEDW